MRRCRRWIQVLLVPALAAGTAACGSMFVAAGPSFDASSWEVGGVDEGYGGVFEIGAFSDTDATGPGAVLLVQLLGYASAGDGDPIGATTLDGRYRSTLGSGGIRGVYGAGVGAGVGWAAGIRALAVPVSGELGVLAEAGPLSLSLSFRPRVTIMLSGGSPATDPVGSAQLVLGAGVRTGPSQ